MIRAALALAMLATPALADDLANIRACVAAIQANGGTGVDEFNVAYQRRILQTHVARWPGISCEVADGKIWKLKMNGAEVVIEGWPSPAAKAAFDSLDAETADALRTLDTRRQVLAQRLAEAQAQLRQDGTDIGSVSAYVRDGISRALGQ